MDPPQGGQIYWRIKGYFATRTDAIKIKNKFCDIVRSVGDLRLQEMILGKSRYNMVALKKAGRERKRERGKRP